MCLSKLLQIFTLLHAFIKLAKMQGFIKIKIHSIQPNENLKMSTLLGQIKIVALEKLIQSDRNVEEVIFNCFKLMRMSSILKIILCFSLK